MPRKLSLSTSIVEIDNVRNHLEDKLTKLEACIKSLDAFCEIQYKLEASIKNVNDAFENLDTESEKEQIAPPPKKQGRRRKQVD